MLVPCRFWPKQQFIACSIDLLFLPIIKKIKKGVYVCAHWGHFSLQLHKLGMMGKMRLMDSMNPTVFMLSCDHVSPHGSNCSFSWLKGSLAGSAQTCEINVD